MMLRVGIMHCGVNCSTLRRSELDEIHCVFRRTIDTPIGQVSIAEREQAIVALYWETPQRWSDETALLCAAEAQLVAYFSGELTSFDLPLQPSGDAFQQRVCQALSAIPYGKTCTYGELAKALGTAAQPIGQACAGNSIPIIIPCHRVLAAKGLGGYSGWGGVETKIRLLKHENAYPYLL